MSEKVFYSTPVTYRPEFLNLLRANKPLNVIRFATGVPAINPDRFNILSVCKFDWCPSHVEAGVTPLGFSHVAVAFAEDYTRMFGPGIYLDTERKVGKIFGHMNETTQDAFCDGSSQFTCGCRMTRLAEKEVSIMDLSDWRCKCSGHLVDER